MQSTIRGGKANEKVVDKKQNYKDDQFLIQELVFMLFVLFEFRSTVYFVQEHSKYYIFTITFITHTQ